MGTISDKLMRIINTKEDIRQALISKGYDVPTSIPFKEYAKMISDLPCRVDSFPDIEGIVARYSALGLTNEQMAANPVWVDKTGNGHDLQMKNFAWKEGSGISDIYPGALVFDGVDDYGACDNFPILTKEKGYTVVALRQWISMGEGISGLVSNVKNWFNDGAFVLEYNSNNVTNKFVNRPVSFGNVNIEMDLPNNFTYQTSKSYKGVPITTDSFKGTNSLFVGKLNNIIGNCSNVAIWELVFLDHDATEEELTKIKDYFVKTYPWLFPDQAWTVVGKTNEDEDRATIANITGNRVQDSSFKLNKDWTLVGEWVLLNQKATNAGIVKPFSFVIYNRTTGLSLFINSGTSGTTIENVKSIKAICSDGRIYLDDWSEMLINKDQNITSSTSVLSIGFNGTAYTQIALKNLGIYNDQLLSKDDCIKAYNYLQTLKAK